ncbi:Hypothetical_protein [Hexamita inflata]|uniref:Hypothetical_protein n=1 Tax=Hexamita inflata TaxID=28002 RepID=A0AA86PMP1_9EUKA|nr:Hypothetical protein HINF_LOCUS6063 [Hexamita inflata]CAI9942749.1 Hypothetical protein HINF_LOCUS30394 [Hexamita inflata]
MKPKLAKKQYAIFLEEKKQYGNEQTLEEYNNLSAFEKARLTQLAKAEKKRYQTEVQRLTTFFKESESQSIYLADLAFKLFVQKEIKAQSEYQFYSQPTFNSICVTKFQQNYLTWFKEIQKMDKMQQACVELFYDEWKQAKYVSHQ